ncbi:hypothetical protein F8M49_21105 [Rhodococcus zopfii]|uniref:Uncharacterized protein n=1 Tax=Rhodococcus zopfii TaxID=43772 RepID=A0ABU3WT98_9NOCA|nr:hypothetical protein [Rhodococcus zopfii]MDV2477220.1 hypothetical protein [Rhodococcus zopfii]
MSLELALRVNGEVIGTIRATHAPACITCRSRPGRTRHTYEAEIREINPDGEVTRHASVVRHTPELGAWSLIQDILDQHPKRAWKP